MNVRFQHLQYGKWPNGKAVRLRCRDRNPRATYVDLSVYCVHGIYEVHYGTLVVDIKLQEKGAANEYLFCTHIGSRSKNESKRVHGNSEWECWILYLNADERQCVH